MRLFDSLCDLVVRVLVFTTGFHPNDYSGAPALVDPNVPQKPIIATPIIDPSLGDDICNTPDNRQVWCDGRDINTDYEVSGSAPPGVVRNYYIVVSNDRICPDGKCVDVTLINGTYPGPTLYANWGDVMNITVLNKLNNCNGTSIHYHGLRQWFTPYADGVPGVTQCPFIPGSEMTYTWNVQQYGSSWYHSHFSLQYANGVLGPLVLYGPSSCNYDIDAGPILVTDWYHEDAFTLFPREVTNADDRSTNPDSMLINGMGNYTMVRPDNVTVFSGCELPDSGPDCYIPTGLWNTTVQAGKRYKFRLVNTSVRTHLTFSIDNHTLEVISTDFVPIVPYSTDTLTIAIGQRYEVIVEANADISQNSNFWIKLHDCGNLCAGDPYPTGFQGGWEECRRGIFSYDQVASVPTKTEPNVIDVACADVPLASMTPIVTRTVTNLPSVLSNLTKIPGFQVNLGKNDVNSAFSWWSLKDFTFRVNWSDPTTSNILEYPNYSTWQPTQYEPVYLDGNDDDWVAFLIEGEWSGGVDPQFQIPAAHPIHLHGHDYVILGQDSTPFDPNQEYALNLQNPPRRDVAMLPRTGFLIIAFKLDNPGPWLMHCHIAFHASAGLAVQFVENPVTFKNQIMTPGLRQQYYDQCNTWVDYYNQDLCNFRQEDSGI
ncbi:Laccase-2 [Dactylellina cionopaga]|nr:Laccase-2 [Dactylellina cionopaga]